MAKALNADQTIAHGHILRKHGRKAANAYLDEVHHGRAVDAAADYAKKTYGFDEDHSAMVIDIRPLNGGWLFVIDKEYPGLGRSAAPVRETRVVWACFNEHDTFVVKFDMIAG